VSVTAQSTSPTIKVDSRGRLVVTVRNASARSVRVRVRAIATFGSRKLTIATRTLTLRARRSVSVSLTVSSATRKRLGHTARPLRVTVTPLTGSSRKAGVLATRVTSRA
jgi:hypothetical protein